MDNAICEKKMHKSNSKISKLGLDLAEFVILPIQSSPYWDVNLKS